MANKQPSLGQWLKLFWLDLLTMAVLGGIGLGVFFLPAAKPRRFPVFHPSGDLVNPQFAYPLLPEIIPIWLSALLSITIPAGVFLIAQIWIRSFWDLNAAMLGLYYALVTAATFQSVTKWLIGGFRPHFLTICQPRVPRYGPQTGTGFAQMYYDASVCTTDQKRLLTDSMESFPSGHTTAGFVGAVFLALYLSSHLNQGGAGHWKLVLTTLPLLGASLIGCSLTIDGYHNWYDVLAGAVMGSLMALGSYRLVYGGLDSSEPVTRD